MTVSILPDFAGRRAALRAAEPCSKCPHPKGSHIASDRGCMECICFGFVSKLPPFVPVMPPVPLPRSDKRCGDTLPWWFLRRRCVLSAGHTGPHWRVSSPR